MNRLLHYILENGEARAVICQSHEAAESARITHAASRVCTAALGRAISAVAMMNSMQKNKNDSITLAINGNGPAGALVAVARDLRIKASINHPEVQLPLRKDGKLDVGGALGSDGKLTIAREISGGMPYTGMIELVSGEIAEDLAEYFTISEQTPSMVSLGVMVGNDKVVSSGGMIIQAMPGCSDDTLLKIETNIQRYVNISAHLQNMPVEKYADYAFIGMDYTFLQENTFEYRCDCSRERLEGVLVSMGAQELEDIIKKQGNAEAICHFCNTKYDFTKDELETLLKNAKEK